MIEIVPVDVIGPTGGGNSLRRRRAFEVASLWLKKDVYPPYDPSVQQTAPYNVQVNPPEMAALTTLRESTGGQLGMDSITGYWPFPTPAGTRLEDETLPNGTIVREFARVAFTYQIVESDEYHKPWDGITVGMICKANWVTITKVTTYEPGQPPVVVETVVSTPNDIQFSKSFVKSDWVYDPMAPSQIYGRAGSATYNNITNTWDLVNPDLVSGEFKINEWIDTYDYDPGTGIVVVTKIRSELITFGVSYFYTYNPFYMEYCTNPGFWFG